MDNHDFKEFANSFQAIARLRLESIECLLRFLGNPQNDLSFIHIAGTNGKGSVCSFLQCIFTASGVRTGKYTSPNLVSVRERISVDGEYISQSDLDCVMSEVESAAEKVRAEQGELPTQFEIWTAAAFRYYKQKKCGLVILETGLGGTRDATNIIPPPLASVITGISLDHTEYLGSTISEIASQKAGIIKRHTDGTQGLTVSAPQVHDAAKVISNTCRKRGNTLVFANAPHVTGISDFHESFDCTLSDGRTLSGLTSGICGSYQPENAAVAAETAARLGVGEEYIREGIKAAKNAGRFEIIRRNPTVIYDGAHNRGGMQALVRSLTRGFPDWHGAAFITAFMADKDIDGAFAELAESGLAENSDFFAVQVKDNPRAASPSQICSAAARHGIRAKGAASLADAYSAALSLGKPVILCGSLYLYKDFSEIEEDALRL